MTGFERDQTRGLIPVQVLQHRHRRIPPVDSDHASARMRACSAQIHSRHRRSRAQPVRPHVLRQALALKNMSARQSHLLLDIRRPQHLRIDHRRIDPPSPILLQNRARDFIASCRTSSRRSSQLPLRKLVRHILRKDTHRLRARAAPPMRHARSGSRARTTNVPATRPASPPRTPPSTLPSSAEH